MSLNGVIFNRVGKVTLLCFSFALLCNVIGVELKLAPYFKSVRLKIKSNRDLVTFVFSRSGKITCFYSFSWLYSYFYFTLILVLQHSTEMLSERKPSWLGIFKKKIFTFIYLIVLRLVSDTHYLLSTSQRLLLIK